MNNLEVVMKFLAMLTIAATLVVGGVYVKDNAVVVRCHDKKILFVKYDVECKTEKRFG